MTTTVTRTTSSGLPGWKPVPPGDLFDIANRVQELDPEAILVRYVARDGAYPHGQLGVARWVEDQELDGSRTQYWWLAITCRDPATAEPMVGVADGRILMMMRLYDSWRSDNTTADTLREARRIRREADAAERREYREKVGPTVERTVHELRREAGVKDRIYVPKAS